FPLRCDPTLTRTAAIQLLLDLCVGQFDVRRATADHHAYAAPVRFAKSGDAKELAEGTAHCVAILIQSARKREVDRLHPRRCQSQTRFALLRAGAGKSG